MAVVVVGKFTAAHKGPGNLKKAETHEIGAQRHGEVDQPHRHFEIGRNLIRVGHFPNENCAKRSNCGGEKRSSQQAKQNNLAVGAGGGSRLISTSTPT